MELMQGTDDLMEISVKKESLRSIGITGCIFFIIIFYAAFEYGIDITPALKNVVFGIILGGVVGVFLYLLQRYLKSNPTLLEKHPALREVFLPEEFPEHTRAGYYVAIYQFFMAGIFIAMVIGTFPPPLWVVLMMINFLPHGFLWSYLNYRYNKSVRNKEISVKNY